MATIVLPGDVLPQAAQSTASVLKLGPGLISPHHKSSSVTTSHAGLLGHQSLRASKEGTTESWWVEVQGKRVSD